MTFHSSELKFQFNKKGQLKIQEKEVWKDDIDATHTVKSPNDAHNYSDIEEDRKKELVRACIATLERFLGSDGETIFASGSILDQDEPDFASKEN